MSAFEDWYHGLLGFTINSERIVDDLSINTTDTGDVDSVRLEKWMRVCWNNAIEAAMNSVVEDYGYDDNMLLLTSLKVSP
jgi:hypothetical protein